MKNKLIKQLGTAVFFGTVLIFLACGSSDSTDDSTNGLPASEAANTEATLTALSSVDPSSLEAASNVSELRRIEGGEMEEDGEGESTTRDQRREAYNCSYDEAADSHTCSCEGGGSVIHQYSDRGPAGATWSASFTTTFDACVIEGCGGRQKTIDGEIAGSMTGIYSSEELIGTGAGEFRVTHETAEACSGLTIDGVAVGFEMTEIFYKDSSEEDFNGCICFDPPGDIVCFDNREELWDLMDPDNACLE